MQHAASLYAKTAQTTLPPRELEAAVLIKSAARLQGIADHWDERASDLAEALTVNRKIWTILVTSATASTNPLPTAVKDNIASLGLFVFTRTLDLMAQPTASKIAALVTINREIAAGLRATPPADQAA